MVAKNQGIDYVPRVSVHDTNRHFPPTNQHFVGFLKKLNSTDSRGKVEASLFLKLSNPSSIAQRIQRDEQLTRIGIQDCNLTAAGSKRQEIVIQGHG